MKFPMLQIVIIAKRHTNKRTLLMNTFICDFDYKVRTNNEKNFKWTFAKSNVAFLQQLGRSHYMKRQFLAHAIFRFFLNSTLLF